MQSDPSALELATVLAMHRGGNLSGAASLLGADGSTVFRTLRRLEQGTQQRLFDRSRSGYRATELGLQWAAHAERIEAELEAVRSLTQQRGSKVSGRVRISTTDTLLQGILLPALAGLAAAHPLLAFDLDATNEPASLTRRDADLALRATRKPPDHLVGRSLGVIRAAVFARRPLQGALPPMPALRDCPWIAPDEALPDHLSVRWRKRHLPKLVPRYAVHSVLGVLQAIEAGLGVGILPLFLAARRAELIALSDPLEECETQLWLLTHPESRHLRRISTVAAHLAQHVRLD